jgi:7-cyano-7-deazaguanine synthase
MVETYGNGKVLLYSGGMDSWIINKLLNPDVKLYIDIKGSYNAFERAKLPADVVVETLDLHKFERKDKIVPLRNLFFISLASLYGTEIYLGATAGDRVLDKSPVFAQMAEELLSYLWREQHWTYGRPIYVHLPFKTYTKTELLKEYIARGFDLEEAYYQSFSCYSPDEQGHPCWQCKACVRKYIAFYAVGFPIPPEHEEIALHFISQNPAMFAGRGDEEVQILKILSDKFKQACNPQE